MDAQHSTFPVYSSNPLFAFIAAMTNGRAGRTESLLYYGALSSIYRMQFCQVLMILEDKSIFLDTCKYIPNTEPSL